MTVKELCDLYGCSRTAMHHKIKRNEERLKGHITYEKGNKEISKMKNNMENLLLKFERDNIDDNKKALPLKIEQV